MISTRRARARVRRAPLRAAVALALLPLAGANCGSDPVETPNILLIIGDDHGYPDFGFMGSPHVKTPHLDRLAREGTVFRHGYTTASWCLPSLRSLLTGLHPIQWQRRVRQLRAEGVKLGGAMQIREFETLPRMLGDSGYQSFQAGKLWEASYELAGFSEGMVIHGPDTAACEPGGLGRDSMPEVLAFVRSQSDRRFFVWFAPCLPHLPHDAPSRYGDLYAELDLSPSARAYYASISRFDDRVGELMELLEELGLEERTLVVYVSDNGWDQGPHASHHGIDDGPRGKKSIFDLGFRTPIILRQPGSIPAGAVRDELVSIVDLVPTFLDYAELPPLPDLPGESLRPLIEGRAERPDSEVIGGWLPWSLHAADIEGMGPSGYFVRKGKWHYLTVSAWGGREALFDVRADPREDRNLAAQHPDVLLQFRKRLQRWQEEMHRPFASSASDGSRGRP